MIAFIGGSGLVSLSDILSDMHNSDFSNLGVIDTPFGQTSSAVEHATCQEQTVLFVSRHGDQRSQQRVLPHCVNYRANLWALKSLGATSVVSINAVGGIADDCQTQRLVVPHQLIDYTWGRAHTFFDGVPRTLSASDESLLVPNPYIEFTQPYDETLRQTLIQAVKTVLPNKPCVERACYGATQGPRLETAAEIRRMQQDGADIVGMTGMPETSLAKELSLPYAALCLVVNRAAGLNDKTLPLDDIMQVIELGMNEVKQVLRELLVNRQ